ncbi:MULTISPECIES: hypothetical protein [unclassified Yoonia]|uniref:hypothetical protein n=1 Tax=unclassified Yoonia TaxID=2629118 RepID=UPI002AFF1E56|nr:MULTISPECIES: hypothetical protein [unclassified Yoonia]
MIGSVEFELDGKVQTMRISTNAQVRYQRAAGETFLTGLAAIEKSPSDTERLRRLIWAALSHVDGLTEDAAGDIMDELGIEVAIGKLSEAVAAAYPKAAADAVGNGAGAANKSLSKK